MKKYIFILLFCLLSLSTHAEGFSNCVPFTARNGKHFCYRQATNGITWAAAMAWCDAQGFRLASPNELCDIDEQPWNRMITSQYGCKNIVVDQSLIEGMPGGINWLRGLDAGGGGHVVQGIGMPMINDPKWGRTPLCAMD